MILEQIPWPKPTDQSTSDKPFYVASSPSQQHLAEGRNSMTLEEIRKALDGVTADLTTFRAGTREHPYFELAAAKKAIKTSIETLTK